MYNFEMKKNVSKYSFHRARPIHSIILNISVKRFSLTATKLLTPNKKILGHVGFDYKYLFILGMSHVKNNFRLHWKN